jgi:hypothetical protein
VRANEQGSAVLVDATVSAATPTWHGSYLSRKGAGWRVKLMLPTPVVTDGNDGVAE